GHWPTPASAGRCRPCEGFPRISRLASCGAWADWGRSPLDVRPKEVRAMIDDLAPAGTVADLFDPEPSSWGLRGDPYLWRSMRAMLAKRVLPSAERDLVEILRSAFRWLTGNDIEDTTTDRIYREELARGGMTSGQVDLEVWRN